MNATAGAKPQAQQVNLGLQLGYSGTIDRGQFNIGVGAMYKDDRLNSTLNASYKTGKSTVGLQGSVGPDKGGTLQYGGLLTLSVDL